MRRSEEITEATMKNSDVTEKKRLICKQYRDKSLSALQQLQLLLITV